MEHRPRHPKQRVSGWRCTTLIANWTTCLPPKLQSKRRTRPLPTVRPVTAAGPPILGRCPVENLYLNVGHGAAGWTEACATSRAVAEIVGGQAPGLDMEGLAYVQ